MVRPKKRPAREPPTGDGDVDDADLAQRWLDVKEGRVTKTALHNKRNRREHSPTLVWAFFLYTVGALIGLDGVEIDVAMGLEGTLNEEQTRRRQRVSDCLKLHDKTGPSTLGQYGPALEQYQVRVGRECNMYIKRK